MQNGFSYRSITFFSVIWHNKQLQRFKITLKPCSEAVGTLLARSILLCGAQSSLDQLTPRNGYTLSDSHPRTSWHLGTVTHSPTVISGPANTSERLHSLRQSSPDQLTPRNGYTLSDSHTRTSWHLRTVTHSPTVIPAPADTSERLHSLRQSSLDQLTPQNGYTPSDSHTRTSWHLRTVTLSPTQTDFLLFINFWF